MALYILVIRLIRRYWMVWERLDIKTGNGQILLGNRTLSSNSAAGNLGSQTTTSAAVGSEKSVFGQWWSHSYFWPPICHSGQPEQPRASFPNQSFSQQEQSRSLPYSQWSFLSLYNISTLLTLHSKSLHKQSVFILIRWSLLISTGFNQRNATIKR